MKKALPSGNTRPNLKVPMAFMCCSERHVNALNQIRTCFFWWTKLETGKCIKNTAKCFVNLLL